MKWIRTLAIFAVLPLAACGQADGGAGPGPGDRPKAFAQCATCHSVVAGNNGIGPSLAGVYGAKAAHNPAYAYSSAMRGSGLVWDEATLDAYLQNPRGVVPGTKMSYPGLSDDVERKELIDWLAKQ